MLLFHPNIRSLMIGRGLLAGLANPTAVTVFRATQPTAAQLTANWSSYTSEVMLHWNGVGFSQPLNGAILSIVTFPPPATATAAGFVSWAVIWSNNVTAAQVAGSTLPDANFIIGPCTASNGSGIIRVANATVAIGNSVSIQDGSITASL